MKHYPDYPKAALRPCVSPYGAYVVRTSEVTYHYFPTVEEAAQCVRKHNAKQALKNRPRARRRV